GRRQRDLYVDDAIGVDVDRTHHLELDDVASQLGVDHCAQGFGHLVFGRHGSHSRRTPPRATRAALGQGRVISTVPAATSTTPAHRAGVSPTWVTPSHPRRSAVIAISSWPRISSDTTPATPSDRTVISDTSTTAAVPR